MEVVLEAVLLELVALLAKLALDRLLTWLHEQRAVHSRPAGLVAA